MANKNEAFHLHCINVLFMYASVLRTYIASAIRRPMRMRQRARYPLFHTRRIRALTCTYVRIVTVWMYGTVYAVAVVVRVYMFCIWKETNDFIHIIIAVVLNEMDDLYRACRFKILLHSIWFSICLNSPYHTIPRYTNQPASQPFAYLYVRLGVAAAARPSSYYKCLWWKWENKKKTMLIIA